MTVPIVFVPHLNRTVRLGRKRPHAHKRVRRFASYVDLAILRASIPDSADYSPKAAAALAQMYGNDQYGDCVIAGEGHLVGVRTGNESGTPAVFATRDIVAYYEKVCGPGDQGCVITDVLDAQKTQGFVGGHKISGYVSVDDTNQAEVRAAIYLFGGITLGINLPGSWANNAAPGFVWDNTNDPAVGGHEVVCMGYNAKGVITSTWGMLGLITWAALADARIVDECYVAIGPDWTDGTKPAPNGLDLATLTADLQVLGGGNIPPVTPPTPPVPVPPTPTGNVLTLTTSLSPGVYSIEAAQQLQTAFARAGVTIPWAQILAFVEGILPLLINLLNQPASATRDCRS
jgi:hypothetical protein